MSALDYRSWGETRDCEGCRFWSEMVAQAIGGGPIQALCINGKSPLSGKYTTKRMTCEAWQEGSLGAVDQPGGDPYATEDSDNKEGDSDEQ